MEIKIGTVVSLKSNSLLQSVNCNFLSIGGNENFVTPLMVVVETVFKTTSEIDEETGEITSNLKGANKYKCTYFSNRGMKLEENWFFANELQTYGGSTESFHNSINSKDLKWGDTVRFKTVDEEAKKTKSFSNGDNQKRIKPLMTFTSPAMQIIGFANSDSKEPLIDSYTGKKKREKTKKLVKCKFFNVEADKFSEQLIPIECLQKIDNSKMDELFAEISRIIEGEDYIIVKDNDSKYFGRPMTVNVYSGRYQLVFYNELIKRNEFIWMDLIQSLQEVDITDGEYYPGIHPSTNNLVTVYEFLQGVEEIKGCHFKITYKNLKEQIVSRFITVKEISKPFAAGDESEQYFYIKSHCHLRNAEREFRSDRILSIRNIENKILVDFLNL